MIALTQQDLNWRWSLVDQYGQLIDSGIADSEDDALQQAWSVEDQRNGMAMEA